MNAKTAVVAAALGIAPADAPAESTPDATVPSFDGGARQSPPLAPETHGEWLARVIRGEPDVPSDWPWPHA